MPTEKNAAPIQKEWPALKESCPNREDEQEEEPGRERERENSGERESQQERERERECPREREGFWRESERVWDPGERGRERNAGSERGKNAGRERG